MLPFQSGTDFQEEADVSGWRIPKMRLSRICFRPYGNETDWIMDLFWKVFSEIMVQFAGMSMSLFKYGVQLQR